MESKSNLFNCNVWISHLFNKILGFNSQLFDWNVWVPHLFIHCVDSRPQGGFFFFFFQFCVKENFTNYSKKLLKVVEFTLEKQNFPIFLLKKWLKCRLKNPALQTILVIFWATNSRYCAKFALRKKLAKTFVFSKQNKNKIVSLARSNCLKRKENCTIFSLALPTLWKTNCIYQSDHS